MSRRLQDKPVLWRAVRKGYSRKSGDATVQKYRLEIAASTLSLRIVLPDSNTYWATWVDQGVREGCESTNRQRQHGRQNFES